MVGGWGPFSKSTMFNYFRHNKSEPYLTDDFVLTVFPNFLPNRFRLNVEPHELVWKSVTANLHKLVVSIFKMFFLFPKSEIHGRPLSDFSYSRTK